MSDERDILDRIDELVDEQLANYDRRTGYDYNVGGERCAHCGGDWHGLPITENVRGMRRSYCGCDTCQEELDGYRADADDSPVWCPGSTFIGPWATPAQLAQIRAGTPWGDGSSQWLASVSSETAETYRRIAESLGEPQAYRAGFGLRPGLPFYRYREVFADADELDEYGPAPTTVTAPGRWTLPELSFPVPDYSTPATSFTWSLYADTNRASPGEEPWLERLGGMVVLDGAVDRRSTDRGEAYISGYVTVREVSPRAIDPDTIARGVFVEIRYTWAGPVYARMQSIERVDYGGDAWRVKFDQRRPAREYVRVPGSRPTRREWRVIDLVEPSPPVPWGPDHPHYRYSTEEQLRLAREQDERPEPADLGPVRIALYDANGRRLRDLTDHVQHVQREQGENGIVHHTFTIDRREWELAATTPNVSVCAELDGGRLTFNGRVLDVSTVGRRVREVAAPAPATTRERGWSLTELEHLRRVMWAPNPMLAPLLQEQLDETLAPLYVNGGRRNGRHTADRAGHVPGSVADAIARIREQLAELRATLPIGEPELDPWGPALAYAGDLAAARWLPGDPEPGDPELDERGRPRPPRPSTTPPMWANNPTRTRRSRNR